MNRPTQAATSGEGGLRLTYCGDENRNCDPGDGAYNFDLGGHPVRLCVWPTGITGDDTPFANLSLYNGSHEGDDPSIAYWDMFAEEPLMADVMAFHEAILKGADDAFDEFQMPLLVRLLEGLIAYAHVAGAAATAEENGVQASATG